MKISGKDLVFQLSDGKHKHIADIHEGDNLLCSCGKIHKVVSIKKENHGKLYNIKYGDSLIYVPGNQRISIRYDPVPATESIDMLSYNVLTKTEKCSVKLKLQGIQEFPVFNALPDNISFLGQWAVSYGENFGKLVQNMKIKKKQSLMSILEMCYININQQEIPKMVYNSSFKSRSSFIRGILKYTKPSIVKRHDKKFQIRIPLQNTKLIPGIIKIVTSIGYFAVKCVDGVCIIDESKKRLSRLFKKHVSKLVKSSAYVPFESDGYIYDSYYTVEVEKYSDPCKLLLSDFVLL